MDVLEKANEWRDYYSDESEKNEKRYHITQYVLIIASITIPIINVFELDLLVRIASAILGSIIVGVTWLNQLRKFHERWINQDKAWKLLDYEIMEYTSKIGKYENPNAEENIKLFKNNILGIIKSIDTKKSIIDSDILEIGEKSS